LQGISSDPRRSTIKIGNFEARADWLLRRAERHESDLRIDHESDLRIDERNSNPADVEGLKNEFQKGLNHPDGTTFKLSFEMRFSMWKSRVALLRMSYLLAFRTFGYAYALNPCIHPVLNQIHSPQEQQLPDSFCLDFKEPPVQGSEILIVKDPPEFRSLLAVLRLRTKKRTVYQGIILPGPFDKEGTIYQRLRENKDTSSTFSGTFRQLCAELIHLDDPAHLLALFFIWRECCGSAA
jgi:hypothetical protein